MQEDAKARQKEGTVAGYSDRAQKATTVDEVEAIEKEEEEEIGGNVNIDRATRTALLTEMPKIKAILESKELSQEDRIKNLATLLQGNAAAHHKAMYEFGGNLDLTLNKDPQEAAKELVTRYDELQAPNNPDPKKDVFNSLLNQKLSEEVGQEVEDAPDVNTREANTSTFDSNPVTITSTDESFVGNLFHFAGREGAVERGNDGTPLPHPFYETQTKGDNSIDKHHLDPKFKIDGAKVFYVIDGTNQYNQGDRDSNKPTYQIEMFVNVNGEEIFIGAIPANAAPELREAIESEYEASEARTVGTRFTSKKKGQVKSKLPGRILNLPDGKFADLNTILEKYPDVKLITTVVTNGTVTLAGLEEAGLSTSDIVITNPENLAAAGKNKKGQPILKGGYVYALVPAPDGRYFPVKLFTKKVGEVESLKNKVSSLVDGLYNSNPEVAEDALSQLKDLIHINRDKSNFKIKLEGNSVRVNGQKAEQEKLKETLLSTKQGEGAIAFIDKAKMNSSNYNADVAEYLNHNMDVSVGIHSPSYKVNAQFTALVKPPSERSKEIVAGETATGTTTSPQQIGEAAPIQQVSDVKSQKADIERRRAEELDLMTVSEVEEFLSSRKILSLEEDKMANAIFNILGRKMSGGNLMISNVGKEGKGRISFENLKQAIINLSTDDYQIDKIFDMIDRMYKIEGISPSSAEDKIKAKYDAELAALKSQPTTEETVDIPVNDMTIVYNPQTGEMTFKTTGGTPNETVSNKALVRYETTQGTLRRVTYNNTKYAILSDERIISLSKTSVGKEVFKKGPQRNKILEQAGEVPTPVQPTQTSEVEEQGQDLLSLISAEDIANANVNPNIPTVNVDSNKPSVISEEEVNSAEDVEDEINFISNVLGGDALVQTYVDEGELVGDIPTVAGLVQQVKSKGQVLEGLFTEAGIYLRTKGPKGRG